MEKGNLYFTKKLIDLSNHNLFWKKNWKIDSGGIKDVLHTKI